MCIRDRGIAVQPREPAGQRHARAAGPGVLYPGPGRGEHGPQQECCVGPVSYTHLDVYKRQAHCETLGEKQKAMKYREGVTVGAANTLIVLTALAVQMCIRDRLWSCTRSVV